MWLFPISGADDNAYYDPVIKAYEDSHPNVNVEIQWIPGEKRQELYLASITGGTPPDVFLMNSDTFATYADSGALLDMSSYWSQGELSDFYPNVIQDSSWLGKLYMIPTDVSSTPVIYNKDMFKAAGLDPEKPPTNWDEFLSDCEVLTIDKNGKHYGETGFDASNVVQWCTSTPLGTSFLAFKWNPWFFQAGGTYFSADGKTVLFDSQAGLDALNMIVKLADNFMPPSDKTAQYGEDITNFEQLRAAMIPCIENYAAGVIATDVPGLNFGLGPVLKNKVQVSHGAETGYSISATTKNPEAVVELIKFLTSTETLDKYNVYAGSPATRKSVAEAIQSQVPWWLAYGIGQVQYSRSVASPKIEVVWEDMAKEEQAAVLHQKTTEQALKDATDEINAALQQ
jgi:ABC-type glycerol-3-phosphate transport system substrate-binding protein